ncbi:MAG: ABC transporter ATP-binding protein [candidate division Zixibacteria bacterium]|nr:ABC transporter ATP-binding protein [candidate division Zixibacteria bacterium]MDH3936613.1 ABC transporter ATP-binding protein [candidate division Zixibacteria bacterium]MDH4032582.1 ABC transporter ATP-binding protein [candidate division Zixibacteria bacterium]
MKVLEDISLSLKDGELLVLLGPSGCGKTTLLRMIAGLETTDQGEIYLDETRIDAMRPRDRQVAMVFQNYALYPHMTIAKNLAFPLKIAGVDKAEIADRVLRTSKMLGLSERLTDKPGMLSGGQRQRVALGRAIIRKPQLFLLDEPLSNLDADLRARMRREIVDLQKMLGVTTVYVTHDQTEALTMADRIAVLHEGSLRQVGTPEQLYRDPDCLAVAEFIGQPKLNVIPVQTPAELALFGFSNESIALMAVESGVLLGIRPESIRIVDEGSHEGTVTGCEYLGNQYVLEIDYKQFKLTAAGCKKPLSAGNHVRFDIENAQVLVFDQENGNRLRDSGG